MGDWVNQVSQNRFGFYYFTFGVLQSACSSRDGLHSACTWVRPGCQRICFPALPSALSKSCLPVSPDKLMPPKVVKCSSHTDSRSLLGIGTGSWAQEVFYLSPGTKVVFVFLIGVYLLYSVVLVSTVQRSGVPCAIQQVISYLHYTYIVIYFIHIYVNPSLTVHPTPNPAFPPWCPYICSLPPCLYFCLANQRICTIFLGSTYMC